MLARARAHLLYIYSKPMSDPNLFALQNMKSNKVDALEACFVIIVDGSAVSNAFKSLK